MASAWIYQDDKQVKKHGPDRASWYVGWIDPEGKRRCKSCGAGLEGQRNAEKLRRKIEAQLVTGTYQGQANALWKDFRREWDDKVGAGLDPNTRRIAEVALRHFERLCNPVKTYFITAKHIDHYVSKRRQEAGQHHATVSPATVNKELRHLRAVLNVGKDWGYLPTVPRFRMLREPGKLPRYVTGDHFAAMYVACDAARMPQGLPSVTAADWWRALLVTGYMTGWRIGDLIAMRREDLDMEAGTVITRWEDNKGNRDALVKLHVVVLDHIRRVPTFGPTVLPWNHNRRTLYYDLHRIQEAAGIHLTCREMHEHTPSCHFYGFHDLRRAFATMNADKLTPDALQALMRHKSYQTTQRYINMTRQMDAAVAGLHVPDVLKGKAAGG